MSRIRFEAITKTYRGKHALDGVDLEIEPGSLTVLCGPPLSGKSVLLRLLVGLEQPTAGRILFDGQDITDLPAATRTIGYVPQSFALFPHMSVFDNIAYPLTLQGVAREEIRARVDQAAGILRIRPLLDKKPSQLSGGEKQRTAIARGILKNADIFILDDPLVGLDFKLRESLMEELKDMRAQLDATFLYAT
ncbi:MAG TPA: ABC transporter ATP-binding protein, partial [Acetobacteraceae bacterium]|nr:ABC transporter ATP-binding protein [Acetobacteraceae bacterium]